MDTPRERTIPTGMRDVLPDEARARRRLGAELERAVALFGFELVILPAFEFESVLERGLGRLAESELLRFVEPETGAAAALRPDMTPQIARLVATRLRERPPPLRLAYEGTVLRRRGPRATALSQFGVELVGPPAASGDVEILDVIGSALRAAAVPSFTLDVGDAMILKSFLAPLAPPVAAELGDAFARRDEADVRALARQAGLADAPLASLVRVAGGRDALREGLAVLERTIAAPYAARLANLFATAEARGLPVSVDFGEVRGWSYYTGLRFHAYAAGASRAVGGGGRYDELLRGFGRPLDAVGFSLDLDALLQAIARPGPIVARVAVVRTPEATAILRGAGVPAVDHDDEGAAEAHARAWGYTHVLSGGKLRELATGTVIEWNASAASSLVATR